MQILTQEGFKDFDGFISQGFANTLIRFKFSDGSELDCTEDHLLLDIEGVYIEANELAVSDVLYGDKEIITKEIVSGEIEVFDALNVEETNSYLTNGVVSHNCLDEFAFIAPGVFEDFIQSVYPTISTSVDAKILMVSTPWGLNHFYKFWKEAEDGKNGYSYFSIKWNDVPGRDEAWRDKMIAEIGIERFRQEFEAEFLGSSNTLIEVSKLRNMVYEDPIEVQMGKKFKVFTAPKLGHDYVIICDVAEGVGGDFSSVQVLDVTTMPWYQVAVYCDNLVKTNIFASVINNIGTAYNAALVIVENNTIGESVLNALNFDHEYENLLFDNKKFGMRMTKGSKRIGCSHLKTFIEMDKLIIYDLATIEQFTYFERQTNGTFSASKNKHDDLVTPLILFSAFMSNENLVSGWTGQENVLSTVYSRAMEEIEENLLPVGFFPNSMDQEEF